MYKTYKPYDEYWNSKGKYGQERVRRKNLRKEKRRSKNPGSCPKCRQNPKVSGTCPYDAEIYGVETYCKCCNECRNACAQDI